VSLHRDVAGFSKAVDAYERGRPGYPRELADWISEIGALGAGRVVVDLAAGTGKLTRELVGSRAEVIAVEPLAEMRAALIASLPGVRTVEGTAEATTLPAGSADVVTVAQAFHWFATESALAEIARVLRPEGVLVLVWNRRDLTQPIQARVSRIIEPYRTDTPSHASGQWQQVMGSTSHFTRLSEVHVDSEQVVDRSALVDRVGSISFVANLPDAQRSALLAEIAALIGEEPATTALRYVTDAYAYRRA
jgi:SAM-dependent methyltransferase